MWNCTAKRVQRFTESGHLVFKITSALSRGILKRKRQTIIYFNRDFMNTEQLGVCGAVANWCCQFGSKEKRRASISVDNNQVANNQV